MVIMCHDCSEIKECEFVEDPFVAELFPEDRNEPKWRCEDCLEERRDAI